jgi:hypothetical protein
MNKLLLLLAIAFTAVFTMAQAYAQDACSLMTLDEVNTIANGDAKSSVPRANGSECSYQNSSKNAVLTVKMKRGGAKESMQSAVTSLEKTYKRPAKSIASVGDDAQWFEALGTLHVVKGDTHLDLFFTRQKNRTEADTVKAANLMLTKIK